MDDKNENLNNSTCFLWVKTPRLHHEKRALRRSDYTHVPFRGASIRKASFLFLVTTTGSFTIYCIS